MSKTASRRRGAGRRILLALIVLAAATAGAWHLYQRRAGEQRQGTQQPMFTVAEGPLLISVTESGTIGPREQVILSSEIEGRTTILFLVPEGNRVQKGDLLIELDATQLQDSKVDQEIRVQNAESEFIQARENLEVVRNQAQSDIEKAELALRFAKDDLNQYQEGEYPNRLTEFEAKITLAQEDIQRAEEKVKWSRVLFEEKYLSASELQADELAAKKFRLELELARNNLSLLKEYTYKRRVAEYESDARQNEMALERIRRRAAADVIRAEAQLRARELEFRRQQDRLTKIGEQILKAKIVAPTDGLVVYATSTRANWRGRTEPLDAGQEVRERQELIHLPTASTFMAEVKIHESNLDKIRRGMPVRLKIDALPGQSFTGSVARIAPLPDAQSLFMNPDLKVYNTDIHINGGGDVLRTGMTAEVEIMVERFERAMYVPVQAVIRVGGRPTVFVRQGDEFMPREVDIGLDNNRMVRIVAGLTPGEEVMLTPPLHAASTEQDMMSGEMPQVASLRGDSGGSERQTGRTLDGTPAEAGGRAPREPDRSAPPDAAGSGRQQGEAERGGEEQEGERRGRRQLTPEQRAEMRERLQNMSPEEREKLRQQRGGERRAQPPAQEQ